MKIIKKLLSISLIVVMLFSFSFDYLGASTTNNSVITIVKDDKVEEIINSNEDLTNDSVSEDSENEKSNEKEQETDQANAPPKFENYQENLEVSETLDEYVEKVDKDKNSMEYQLITPQVLHEIYAVNDVYRVNVVGRYSGNISEFGVYGQYGPLEVYRINGNLVFCVQFGIDSTNHATQTYEKNSIYNTFSATKKENINIVAAYASKRFNETGNKNYLYAGQIIIWDIIQPTHWNTNTGSSFQGHINELLNLRKNHYVRPSFNASSYKLKYNTSTKRYEAIIKDTNNISSNKYKPFFGTHGDFKVETNGYNSLKVSTSNGNAASRKINGNYTVYGNSYTQFYDAAQDMVSGSTKPINMYFNVSVEPYFGEIVVNKTAGSLKMGDYKKYPQSSVGFELQDQAGKVIYSLKTDKNGKINLKNVSPGTYYLVETSVPNGYKKITKRKVVVNSGKTTTINIENDLIKGSVYLKKIGENLDSTKDNLIALEGVSFSIKQDTDYNGTYETNVGRYETDQNGELSVYELKYGNYEIKEVSTNAGYLLSNESYKFSIRKDNEKIKLNKNGVIENNAIKGSAVLLKVGESLINGENKLVNLEGVKFKLMQDLNNDSKYEVEVGIFETNQNGTLKIDKLDYGKYELSEVESIEGYNLNNKKLTFEITENNKVVDINSNKPFINDVIDTDVEIFKIDNEDNLALPGATFEIRRATLKKDVDTEVEGFESDLNNYEINEEVEVVGYDEEDNPITAVTTNEEGLFNIESLKYGTYVLIETNAPEGYVFDDTPTLFKITTENEIVNLTIKNEKIKNTVVIDKVDITNEEELPGAEICISDSEDKIIECFISTKDSHEVEIEYGYDYKICETIAPEGYVKETKCISFDVTENGITQDFIIKNERIKNTIVIDKVDIANEEELPGAEICISDSEDKIIECFISTKDSHEVEIEYGYDYKICETIAPEGYVKETKCITFDVTENGIKQHFKITNKQITSGEVTLLKIDALTKKVLEGAEFELLIKNENNEYVRFKHNDNTLYTTNSEGKIIIDNLTYGKYAFREVKAPEGYKQNDKLIEFEVKKDKENINLEFSNKKTPHIIVTGVNYGLGVLITLAAVITILVVLRKKIKNN